MPIGRLPSISKSKQPYISDDDMSTISSQDLEEYNKDNGNLSTDLFFSLLDILGTMSIAVPAMLLNISYSPLDVCTNIDNMIF